MTPKNETPLRPSIPNPAAPGEFVYLAPLPPLQALCAACGGHVRYDGAWGCAACGGKGEDVNEEMKHV